jgi:predicted membrane protein
LLFRDGLLVIIGNVVGVIGVLIVYFLSAYFASISAKIIKSIYTKFASITFTETMIAFMIGVFVGMIGMFLVTLIIEFIFKKMNNKFKI